MAKKKKNKKVQNHTKTEAEQLEILIGFSRRAITNQGTGVDEFFTQQAERLEKDLAELRKVK